MFGQIRTIAGKVVDENLSPVCDARINNADTTLLVKTDIEGKFKIDIPSQTQSLIIYGIGMEPKLINLPDNCNYFEIIMLGSATYDFMSERKVDKLRKKQFEKLPSLYKAAFDKGIFKIAKPCFEEMFIPIKERLKEIRKARTKMSGT